MSPDIPPILQRGRARLLSLVPVLLSSILLSIATPNSALANDIAKRQLAADTIAAPTPDQTLANATRNARYQTKWREELRELNALAGNLSGVFVGVPLATALGGPLGALLAGIGGVVTSAAVTDVLDDMVNSIVDRDIDAVLTASRSTDGEFERQLRRSAPHTQQRGELVSAALDQLSYSVELNSRGPVLPETRARLATYYYKFAERLLARDAGAPSAVEGSSDLTTELPDRVRGNDLQTVLDLGRAIDDGRAQLHELAVTVDRLNRDLLSLIGEENLDGQLDQAVAGTVPSGRVVEHDRERLRADGAIVDELGRQIGEHEVLLGELNDRTLLLTEQGEVIDQLGAIVGSHSVALESLGGEIVDIRESYRKLLHKEDFTQSLIYEGLPTAAKIRALKNPVFMEQLDPEQREALLQNLQIQERVAEVAGAAQDYRSLAQSTVSILATTGVVEADDANAAMDVANLAGGAVVAGIGLYTGNPVAIMAGISGLVSSAARLFGGASDGPTVHEQLLEGQRRLLEGQRQIVAGLREVHQEVVQSRVALLNSVSVLDRRVMSRFADLSGSIGRLRSEIGQVAGMTDRFSEVRDRLYACQDFLNRRNDRAYGGFERFEPFPREVLGFAVGEFTTWRGLVAHYRANEEDWQRCWTGMRRLFARRQVSDQVHDIFLLAASPSADGGTLLTSYVGPGLEPMMRFMVRHYQVAPGTGGEMATFCALLNPTLGYEGLGSRGHTAFGAESCAEEGSINAFSQLFGGAGRLVPERWLLSPDALLYTVVMMLEVLPYYQLINEDGGIAGAGEVAYGVPRRPREIETEVVETAYRLTNMAIAQQTLLAGDIFLPVIHRYLFSPDVRADDRAAMVAVLRHNPVVAQNYLVMQLRRELELRSGLGGFSEKLGIYREVRELRATGRNVARSDRLGFDNLLGSYWQFSEAQNAVVLEVEGEFDDERLLVQLPSAGAIQRRAYSTLREYAELLRLRVMIMDHVMRNDLPVFGGETFTRNGYVVWH